MNKVSPGLSFAVLGGVSLALWFRPLLDTLALANGDDKYTHILLIVPLVAALIVQGWRGRSFESQIWAPAAGVLLIALIVGMATRWGALGRSDTGLAIEMVALVTWWIASFVFCFGLAVYRSFRFPLFFLFWMVPIPKIALDPIVAGLQRGSIVAAQLLFLTFRVPVSQEGITLFIPGLDIDVTPECSSIRSSLMLLVTTMVLVYVLLRSPWRRALVIAFAVPLSIAKNGLRIFTIGMLSTHVDAGYLTGRLHRKGGGVFFLIALAMIFVLIWIFRRGERAKVSAVPLSSAQPSPS
jgi:exosortase